MKTILSLCLGILLFSCSRNTEIEVGQKTSMNVNKSFDAGKVLLGEEIEANFTVKNDGDYPLVIAEVKGSCSCTVAEKPEEPIAPGETAVIKATVKTENASVGKLSKEVRIIANTEPSLTVLKINAEVYRK